MHSPESSGILSQENVMSFPCRAAGKASPWFEQFEEDRFDGRTMNEYIYDTIGRMHDFTDFDFSDYNAKFPLKKELPDGTYKIKYANETHLRYNFQINDNRNL